MSQDATEKTLEFDIKMLVLADCYSYQACDSSPEASICTRLAMSNINGHSQPVNQSVYQVRTKTFR